MKNQNVYNKIFLYEMFNLKNFYLYIKKYK